MSFAWGYSKVNGPAQWPEHFKAARGQRQSPIDIEPAKAQFDSGLAEKPLTIKYDPSGTKRVFNNCGRSVQIAIDSKDSLLEGGPLKNKYRLEQFHFHWGKTDSTGSEHTIDGKRFAGELHLVHWNTELFASFAEAVADPNGLAVLGVLIEVGKELEAAKKLTTLLGNIKNKNDSCDVAGGFDPACMLPSDTSKYWTYPGSLTTPPCFESVTWIVFKDPIQFSAEQLKMFRDLKNTEDGASPEATDDFCGCLVENYRLQMPLHNRTVRSTFRKYFA